MRLKSHWTRNQTFAPGRAVVGIGLLVVATTVALCQGPGPLPTGDDGLYASPSGDLPTAAAAVSPNFDGSSPAGGDMAASGGQALGSLPVPTANRAVVTPPPAARGGAAGDMIGFSHSDGSGTQTITLVHTGKSWMAVYHIDRSGQIRLVSSRPLDADFSLQLNATSPLPEEIRQLGRR